MENIFMFVLISALLVMVPGVDLLLVIKNTILYGKKAGHLTTLGIVAALFVWTLIAVLGLAAIVAKSLFLFNLIKYLGAAYLVWMGIKAWLSKGSSPIELSANEHDVGTTEYSTKAHKSCFYQGILTDLLNPKTLIVYMTLMPQFINTNGNIIFQLCILAAILMALAIVWFIIVVYVLNIIRKWFMKQGVQNIFNKTTGVMLVFIGVRLALEEKAI